MMISETVHTVRHNFTHRKSTSFSEDQPSPNERQARHSATVVPSEQSIGNSSSFVVLLSALRLNTSPSDHGSTAVANGEHQHETFTAQHLANGMNALRDNDEVGALLKLVLAIND